MAQNDKTKSESKPQKVEAGRAGAREDKQAVPTIDFSKLDLTVEKVEERISPSETNVFDK
jgi:hypothetical protein